MRDPSRATVLLLAALAAGCAAQDQMASVLAQPGKYEFFILVRSSLRYPCWASTRERELKGLMDKASRDAGGAMISVIAYQSEYLTARGELRMLETEAQLKRPASAMAERPLAVVSDK